MCGSPFKLVASDLVVAQECVSLLILLLYYGEGGVDRHRTHGVGEELSKLNYHARKNMLDMQFRCSPEHSASQYLVGFVFYGRCTFAGR